MFVLIALFGSLLLFRLIGFFGVPVFGSWHAATTYALALMFLFTASAHFGRLRGDLERMVPPWVPNPRAVVLITGFLEILGAIGLIIPETRWLAGLCLTLFLVAVFPANVHAAKTKSTLAGRPVTPLGVRAPMQALFILLIVWIMWQ
jgi:uncharacterized membrane protein